MTWGLHGDGITYRTGVFMVVDLQNWVDFVANVGVHIPPGYG